MALEWAKPLKDKEAREYAAEAAEVILRKGFDLPRLQEAKIKPRGKDVTIANYRPPMSFEIDMGTITINTHPYIKQHGGYRALEQQAVQTGWVAQDNAILHELAHMIDYYAKHLFPRDVHEQVGDRFDKLNAENVQKILSKYGATSGKEFRAELISGILAGKVYPEEFLRAAYLDTYREHKGVDDIYKMGAGLIPNTSATEQKFAGTMKVLFQQKGSQFQIDILANDKVQDFISSHAQVLDNAFKFEPMSDAMRQRLQRSNYIFSGMKTFHELNEAFPSLIDSNGNRKTFEQFLNDVQRIDRTYNQNYLRAEYNFVHASATMATKWEEFQQDGDRYNLQYRTAHDDRVRPEHAALDRVTLPMSDPFWQEYYPPNGWNCRCTVVQVRKSKYPVTPHDEAMALGEEATGKDTKGIFHFNPGIEQKTIPDYNPYTIRRCRDCDIAKGNLTLAYIPDNEMCAACKLVRQCFEGKTRKSELKRIEENKKLYDKLSKDKRYKEVEFNPETGALKATHLGHNDGEDIGFAFEKKLVDALYKCGHSVILCDEQKKGRDGNRLTSLDMILDGVRMDIKSITKNKDYYGYAINRKNSQLVDFNNRSDVHETADTICIYFDDPTMFSPEKITKGYEYMVANTRKGVCVRHIICAINSAKGLELKTFDFQ